MFRRLSLLMIACLAMGAWTGCGKGDAPPAASIEAGGNEQAAGPSLKPAGQSNTAPAEHDSRYPEVVIHTSLGDIRVRLNAEKAPVTVDNFLANYVRRGFYDGTIFHYVDAEGKMLAAGGFTADYQAREPRAPIINEATNGLKNVRGTIAMARDHAFAQSATSQFFINLADNPDLDHRGTETSEDYGYCVFGEVVAGMDVVDAIAQVKVHDQGDFINTPVQPVIIESVEQVK